MAPYSCSVVKVKQYGTIKLLSSQSRAVWHHIAPCKRIGLKEHANWRFCLNHVDFLSVFTFFTYSYWSAQIQKLVNLWLPIRYFGSERWDIIHLFYFNILHGKWPKWIELLINDCWVLALFLTAINLLLLNKTCCFVLQYNTRAWHWEMSNTRKIGKGTCSALGLFQMSWKGKLK